MLVLGQTLIYRSVKNITSAIATGTGNDLTISGTTATFVSALPDSVGVGCVIQYDDDNDGDIDANDSVCFIHARTSSTIFTVANAAGGTPTATAAADQDWSIFHAYTTANNWEGRDENDGLDDDIEGFDTGTTRNISSSSEQWHVAIYNGNAGSLDIDGWTTGTSGNDFYIRIFAPKAATDVGVSQRHEGVYDTNKAHMVTSTQFVETIDLTSSGLAQVRIEGMQIRHTRNDQFLVTVSPFAVSDFRYSHCLFVNGNTGAYRQNGSAGSTVRISNCIFYGQSGTGAAGIHGSDADFTVYVYNCTFAAITGTGVNGGSGGTTICKNILASASGNDFENNGGTFTGFENNASADATVDDDDPGTNQKMPVQITICLMKTMQAQKISAKIYQRMQILQLLMM
jgi:hypothetical protein